MKKIVLNPVTIAVTLLAYSLVSFSSPLLASPIPSKINRDNAISYLEKDLVKAGLTEQEIQQKFQGLTNKDIVALYHNFKAIKAGGSNSDDAVMGGIIIACCLVLLLASLAAAAESNNSRTYTY
ncbi:MAG: hypothetical protein KAI43_10175 [Candidatus Aureabacteria bacterium]|nr:hypothetical protein [Candidatus Auribacterota bacterium]